VFLSVGAVEEAEPPRFVGFIQDISFRDINRLVSELTDLIQLDARTHNVQYKLELAAALPQVAVSSSRTRDRWTTGRTSPPVRVSPCVCRSNSRTDP
jgi:hypothetical protein